MNVHQVQIETQLVFSLEDLQQPISEVKYQKGIPNIKIQIQKKSQQIKIVYKVLTILTEFASLFTILIRFELFPLLTDRGGGFLASISSLRLRPREPKTFLSSHMST